MAVNISNTKYYKKGEKLPDGTTAKRGTAWNTKTNKPLTGKVVMPSAGQGGMSGVKSYKGGRSVASIDRAKARKQAAVSRRSSTSSSSSSSASRPAGPSAAAKARAARLAANKGVKAGEMKMGAKGKAMRKYNAKTGRWEVVVTTAQSQARAPRPSGGKPGGVPARGTGGAGRRPTGAKPSGSKPASGSRLGTGWANAAFGPGGAASGVGRAVSTAGSYLFGRTESGMVWDGSKWVKKK